MDNLFVVKIGGNVIDDPDQLRAFLRAFATMPGKKILVHGGGKRATELSKQTGTEPRFVNGRRITTEQDLRIAVMVYAGQINKDIVAMLQGYGCMALGMSGADGNIITSVKRPAGETDFGFVGDVTAVRGDFLSTLLDAHIVPVLCAITHDGNGQLLNTNADTIAAEVGIALSKSYSTRMIYCFEKPGVLRDPDDDTSLIPEMNKELYTALRSAGALHSGILPKLENCFHALDRGVSEISICSASGFMQNGTPFTRIVKTAE